MCFSSSAREAVKKGGFSNRLGYPKFARSILIFGICSVRRRRRLGRRKLSCCGTTDGWIVHYGKKLYPAWFRLNLANATLMTRRPELSMTTTMESGQRQSRLKIAATAESNLLEITTFGKFELFERRRRRRQAIRSIGPWQIIHLSRLHYEDSARACVNY